MGGNIVEQTYWDLSYQRIRIEKLIPNDAISDILKKHIKYSLIDRAMFEIGCFPGRYLTYFGELNYTLNGIDITLRTSELNKTLKEFGYKVGHFYQMDYLKAEGRYNVVCSFGFIEHFRNWRDVIRLQASLVDNGGLIIITTPNFSGFFQFWYHKLLDKENLNRHIQESMNPNKWKEIVTEEGFDVIDYGYIGFEFWDENPKKKFVERILKRVLILVAKCINRLTPNHRTTASYCYLVARRK